MLGLVIVLFLIAFLSRQFGGSGINKKGYFSSFPGGGLEIAARLAQAKKNYQ